MAVEEAKKDAVEPAKTSTDGAAGSQSARDRAQDAATSKLQNEVTGSPTGAGSEAGERADHTGRDPVEGMRQAALHNETPAGMRAASARMETEGVDPKKVVGDCKITGNVCASDRGGDSVTPEQRRAQWREMPEKDKEAHRQEMWEKGFDMTATNGEKMHISRSGDTVTASQGDQKFELNKEAGTQRYSDGKGNSFERGTDGRLHATIDGDQFTMDSRGIRQNARDHGGAAVFTHNEHRAEGSGELSAEERRGTIETRVRDGKSNVIVNADTGESIISREDGDKTVQLAAPTAKDSSTKTDAGSVTRDAQTGNIIVSQKDASGADAPVTLKWDASANEGKGAWSATKQDGSATDMPTLSGKKIDAASHDIQVSENTRIGEDGTVYTKMNGSETVLRAGAAAAEVRTANGGLLTGVEAKGATTTTTQCDTSSVCSVTDTHADNTLQHALVAPQDIVRGADGAVQQVQPQRDANLALAAPDLTVQADPNKPNELIAHMGAAGTQGADFRYTESAGTPDQPYGSYGFDGAQFAGTEMRSDYNFYGTDEYGSCWNTDPFSGNSFGFDDSSQWALGNGYGENDPYFGTAYSSYDDTYGYNADPRALNDTIRYDEAPAGEVPQEQAAQQVADANADVSSAAPGSDVTGDKPTLSGMADARVDMAELTSDASRLASLASAAASPEARCILQAKANECSAQAAMLGNVLSMAEAKLRDDENMDRLMGSGQLTADAVKGTNFSSGRQSWLIAEAETEQRLRREQPATMAS
jgi:hypothetical protein